MAITHRSLLIAARRGALLSVTLAAAIAAQAQQFVIDPVATKTSYETKYLGFFSLRGVFDRMTGVFRYDITTPPAERDAFIHVLIDATTIRPITVDTDVMRAWLRRPEFFNVEKFSTIEFTSSAFRHDGEKLVAIDGALTLTGVTRPVTLVVHKSGCEVATPQRHARCTASADVVVKRAEFGMSGWAATVSDDVRIAVELVAVAESSGKAPANVSAMPPRLVP